MNPRHPSRRRVSETTLRASEIASYLYCRRAWWYQRSGKPASGPALDSGLAWHRRHGRRALLAWAAGWSGWLMIVLGLAVGAAAWAAGLLR